MISTDTIINNSQFILETVKKKNNIVKEIKTNVVTIEEKAKGGRGKINLDFTNKINKGTVLIQIEHKNKHGKDTTLLDYCVICDGIVMLVDLDKKIIEFYLCELKITINSNSMKKVPAQLLSALTLSKSLICNDSDYKIKYNMIVGYDVKDIKPELLRTNPPLSDLYTAFYNETKLPFITIGKKYCYYNTHYVKFGDTFKFKA